MERIFITLALDLTDKAPAPGWYLNIVQDGQQLMSPMPLPPEAAYELGQDVQRAMQHSSHELPNFVVPQLVQAGNSFIYQAVQKQLDLAMQAASKVESLRRMLGGLQSIAPQPQLPLQRPPIQSSLPQQPQTPIQAPQVTPPANKPDVY